MDFLKKNKIMVAAVAVIIIALGIFGFMFLPKNATPGAQNGEEAQNVKQLKPEDIGLELSLSSDKHNVDMKISKLDGIKSIDYELDYTAIVTEEGETNEVPRGVLSTIDVKSGDTTLDKEILLGTCSSGTCKYDKITSDIKLILKINYANGDVASVETSIPFDSGE